MQIDFTFIELSPRSVSLLVTLLLLQVALRSK